MKSILTALIIYFVILSSSALAAPRLGYGPMTIEGTITEISWSPERSVKKEPGVLGPPCENRFTWARYEVVLNDTIVDGDSEINSKINFLFKGGEVGTLWIDHKNDDGFLKQGMRIKVYDYRLDGDECKDWSSFEKIDIIEK